MLQVADRGDGPQHGQLDHAHTSLFHLPHVVPKSGIPFRGTDSGHLMPALGKPRGKLSQVAARSSNRALHDLKNLQRCVVHQASALETQKGKDRALGLPRPVRPTSGIPWTFSQCTRPRFVKNSR